MKPIERNAALLALAGDLHDIPLLCLGGPAARQWMVSPIRE
jgi:hypothetical protein